MHLKPCPEPVNPSKVDDYESCTMRDGSIAEGFQTKDDYYERVTQPDGHVRWYRVVVDGVVGL